MESAWRVVAVTLLKSSGRFDTGSGTYNLNYGWIDTGDFLNTYRIDTAINYSGFNVKIVSHQVTMFYVENAPTPDDCSVAYYDAYSGSTHRIRMETKT